LKSTVSGMWCYAAWYKFVDVSVECAASSTAQRSHFRFQVYDHIFVLSKTFMCFEVGPPLRRREGSDYNCSLLPLLESDCWLTLIQSTIEHGNEFSCSIKCWVNAWVGVGSSRSNHLNGVKLKLHGLSPRANYTERATAACRRSDCQLLRQLVPRNQRDGSLRPYSLISRQEPLLLYQVAPQLYSRGWVDPVPDPLLFSFLFPPENLVVPGIEPGPPDL
jgi:hypothetical protein